MKLGFLTHNLFKTDKVYEFIMIVVDRRHSDGIERYKQWVMVVERRCQFSSSGVVVMTNVFTTINRVLCTLTTCLGWWMVHFVDDTAGGWVAG